MEIPEDFCICVRTWHAIDTNNANVTEAANLIIEDINDFLKQKKLSEHCETLSLIKVVL